MFSLIIISMALLLAVFALIKALFKTEDVPPNFVKAWRVYTLFGVMQGYLHPGRCLVLKNAEISKPLSKEGRRLPFALDVYAAGNEKFTITARVWFKRDLSRDAIIRNRARWDDPESILHDLMSDLRKVQNIAFSYSARQMQSPVVLEQISRVLSARVRTALFERGFQPKPEGDDITIESAQPDESTRRAWGESTRLEERVGRFGELLHLVGGHPGEASRAMQTILLPETGANHTTVNFADGAPSRFLIGQPLHPQQAVAHRGTPPAAGSLTRSAVPVADSGPTPPIGRHPGSATRQSHMQSCSTQQSITLPVWVAATLWGLAAGVACFAFVMLLVLALLGDEFSALGWIFGVGLGVVYGCLAGLIAQSCVARNRPAGSLTQRKSKDSRTIQRDSSQ